MDTSTGVAVVLPVKAFGDAKQRLREVIDDDDRRALARHLADGVAQVVHADPGVSLFVACDDEEVRSWATDVGATVAWTPGLGLNGAIEAGVDAAITEGAEHVIVAHADLARPSSLLASARPGSITLVPDRRRDGTNVISFPADARVEPSYGPGSFRRHLARATTVAIATGRRVRVLPDADLGLDVDTVADLRHPCIIEELSPWLRTHPDNRSIPAG